MAIANREMGASGQQDVYNVSVGSLATAVTKFVAVMPYPCTMQSVRSAAQGLSNALTLSFEVIRGSGSSGIAIGISGMVLANRSTSGVAGFSGLAAAGSTLLAFQAGDVVQVISSGANGAVSDLVLQLVVQKTQDIVSYNGVVYGS